jgi:hypothetical protein
VCFYGCLPACILKQIVNVIQLLSAADAIAQTDLPQGVEKDVKKKK